MIDPVHDLPLQRQAKVPGISRSSVYYQARPVSAEDKWPGFTPPLTLASANKLRRCLQGGDLVTQGDRVTYCMQTGRRA
jgi:hypothetical protein